MQAQLQNIFDEEMQRKRIWKEISAFTSHEELKTFLDHRMSYIRKEQLIFHMTLKAAFLQKFKIDSSLCPLSLKLVYTSSYPYQMPRLYFVSENINQLYTVVGRDYFPAVCPSWTAKVQLSDMLPLIATFLQQLMKSESQHLLGVYHRAQFIEMEPLYTLKSCEFYPIQIVVNQRPESCFLIINRFDFILLEPSQTQNYLRLVDAYAIGSIRCIYRSKRTDKKIVVVITLAKEEFALEFLAEDHENIVESLVLKKKTAPVPLQQPEQSQVPPQEFFEDGRSQKQANKLNLEQLNEEIVIYESRLENEFSERVINSLIMLYKRAIEHCSSTNSTNYKMYLNKLQELLSNETVQILLNSTMDTKKQQSSVFFGAEQPESRPATAPVASKPAAPQQPIELL